MVLKGTIHRLKVYRQSSTSFRIGQIVYTAQLHTTTRFSPKFGKNLEKSSMIEQHLTLSDMRNMSHDYVTRSLLLCSTGL